MKAIKTWLATIAVLLCSLTVSAEQFVVGDFCYYVISQADLTVGVTSTDEMDGKYAGTVVIPEKVTYNNVDYHVIAINLSTFSDCSNLTSITIPTSVTTIGRQAFYGCSSLTSISIPASVTKIGTLAFENCSSLTSITIPASVTSIEGPILGGCTNLDSVVVAEDNEVYDSRDNCNGIIETSTNTLISGCSRTTIPNTVTAIGESAFYNCTDLTSFKVPNWVTSIGDYAFSGCTQLRSIEIPNTITSIEDYTFNNCYSLTSIDMPNSVTSIGDYAFSGCYGLASITIPESVTSIGRGAFTECLGELIVNCEIPSYNSSLTPFWNSRISKITIGEKVTSIGDYAFSDNRNVTKVEIGRNVATIGDGAFSGCSNLTSISIPYGVTSIGNSAFANCEKLTSIDLPESLFNVAGNAFKGCKSLTSIDFPDGMTEIDLSGCDGLTSINIPQSVTSVRIQGWGGTSIHIPERVTSLDLAGCSNLVSVNIPKNVTTLDLAGCSSLTFVDIPEGVTSLDLYKCSSLESVTIPASLTSISGYSFSGCTNLASLMVAEGNPKYDSRNNCNAIIETANDELIVGCATTVIPNTIYKIGSNAFSGRNMLTSINIPENVVYIEDYAFENCSNLASVTLSDSLWSIGYGAFENCSALTSIYIPKSVYRIEGNPWSGCERIESISVDAENERFDSRNNCNAVIDNYNSRPLVVGCKNTTIPDDVSVIGEYAFYGCKDLTSIYIPSSVYSIESYAFANSGLTSVSLPSGLTNFENEVFRNCANLTSIRIPECRTIIHSCEFLGCASLKTIKIPNTVTEIRSAAFSGCAIENIVIPNSVTSIGSRAFENCTNLASITLPSSITGLSSEIFRGCTSLKSFDLDGITEIHSYAFANSGLESVHIPASIGTIDNYAFSECENLKSISFAQGYTGYPYVGMFVGCTSLEEIIVEEGNSQYDSRDNCNSLIYSGSQLIQGCKESSIPQGVNAIIPLAFANMTLSDIVIPSSVNFIFQHAFAGASINSITCQATIPPALGFQAFVDVDTSIPVYVPLSAVSDYCTHPGWSQFTNILPLDEDIVISDQSEGYVNMKPIHDVNITYIRTFDNTNWQTLYVPFEIPYENIKDDFVVAYISNVHQFDDDGNGVIDRAQVEAVKMNSGVLKANYPYFIRAKIAGEKSIAVTDATLYVAEENSIDCSSVFDSYIFIGTYSKIPASELSNEEGYYVLNDGTWEGISADVSLSAFRFYLKIESRDVNAVVKARPIEMRVIGDDEEDLTGIDELTIDDRKNPAIIYDIVGRRITNAQDLKGGVYIINGKKVVK